MTQTSKVSSQLGIKKIRVKIGQIELIWTKYLIFKQNKIQKTDIVITNKNCL